MISNILALAFNLFCFIFFLALAVFLIKTLDDIYNISDSTESLEMCKACGHLNHLEAERCGSCGKPLGGSNKWFYAILLLCTIGFMFISGEGVVRSFNNLKKNVFLVDDGADNINKSAPIKSKNNIGGVNDSSQYSLHQSKPTETSSTHDQAKQTNDQFEPILCQTDRQIIRIDALSRSKDGEVPHRYTTWNFPKSTSDNPDVQLIRYNNTTLKSYGFCKTRIVNFTTGNIRYQFDEVGCDSDTQAPNDAVGSISVFIDGELKMKKWCLTNHR